MPGPPTWDGHPRWFSPSGDAVAREGDNEVSSDDPFSWCRMNGFSHLRPFPPLLEGLTGGVLPKPSRRRKSS
jgi:hypothetical protein